LRISNPDRIAGGLTPSDLPETADPPIGTRRLREKGPIMQSNRDVRDSKPRGAGRLAILILGATVLVGFGAASPALADHDYRDGPRVQFKANLPLPPFPFPFPFPVVHKVYRDDYRHYGHSHAHYRDYRDCDRRHYRGRGHKSNGNRGDRYARPHRRHFQHDVRHDRRDRGDRRHR